MGSLSGLICSLRKAIRSEIASSTHTPNDKSNATLHITQLALEGEGVAGLDFQGFAQEEADAWLGLANSAFIARTLLIRIMKVIQAIPGMPSSVTKDEVKEFLQSKLNMQLATMDPDGHPVIQPVWFHYDNRAGRLYTGTQRDARKVRNIRNNPDKIYFSIDAESFPYKGVKGRGKARIIEDVQTNLKLVETINQKYLGTQDHPLAKRLVDNAKTGVEVIIEISPKFYSAWDFAKAG